MLVMKPTLVEATQMVERMRDPLYAVERKYDGVRMLMEGIAGRGVMRFGRSGKDMSDRYSRFANVAGWFAGHLGDFVLDGELVGLDAQGNHLPYQGGGRSVMVVFDVLKLQGEDLTRQPLEARLARLGEMDSLFNGTGVMTSKWWRGGSIVDPEAKITEARLAGWEGFVLKRLDRPYERDYSNEWVKFKFKDDETFVVGGWTDPGGARPRFGALVVGRWTNGGKLECAGSVGGGFSHEDLHKLWGLMKPSRENPFTETVKDTHFVVPELAIDIQLHGRTHLGGFRHPAYVRLRDDLDISTIKA